MSNRETKTSNSNKIFLLRLKKETSSQRSRLLSNRRSRRSNEIADRSNRHHHLWLFSRDADRRTCRAANPQNLFDDFIFVIDRNRLSKCFTNCSNLFHDLYHNTFENQRSDGPSDFNAIITEYFRQNGTKSGSLRWSKRKTKYFSLSNAEFGQRTQKSRTNSRRVRSRPANRRGNSRRVDREDLLRWDLFFSEAKMKRRVSRRSDAQRTRRCSVERRRNAIEYHRFDWTKFFRLSSSFVRRIERRQRLSKCFSCFRNFVQTFWSRHSR